MASVNPAVELKAAGRLGRISLKGLGNASLTPADVKSVNGRTCLHPDRIDRELVEASPDDVKKAFGAVYDAAQCEAIQSMHARMFEATGRGSWPAGCLPKELYPHEGYHAYTIYIEEPGFLRNKSLHREVTDDEWQRVVIDAKVWPSIDNPVKTIADCKRLFSYDSQDARVRAFDRPQWAERSDRKAGQPYTVFDMSTWLYFESTRRSGACPVEVFTGPDGKHNVHEKMIAIPGSTAGYAYFNNATCGDHVTSNIDSLNTSYDLGWATGLRTHEGGHTNNLQHEFSAPQSSHRSVMSYATDNTPYFGYRLAIDPYYVNSPGNRVEDRSWPELRGLYGGEAALPAVNSPGRPPSGYPAIPGEFVGKYNGKVYVVEGEVVIPEGAAGGTYIMQRIGEDPHSARHRLIPKAIV